MRSVIFFAETVVFVLEFAVFARAMLSWFPMRPGNPVMLVLEGITEPVLRPMRKIVPRFGSIDITPMVAVLVLFVLQQALAGFA
jgi:YggT family protein